MVIKHFGEDKNFYDHKLTELEELSDLELQSEDSGSLNNSSTPPNVPQSGEKSSPDLEFFRKRLHQQINPVVRDGVVRDEYADLLSVKEYTPETLEKWSNAAMAWILKQGGVKPAAEQFLKNHAPAEKHVATLARRMIINSDVYANAFSYEQIQYWGHSHRSYPHFAAAVFSVFPARQKKPLSTSASRNVGTDRERF